MIAVRVGRAGKGGIRQLLLAMLAGGVALAVLASPVLFAAPAAPLVGGESAPALAVRLARLVRPRDGLVLEPAVLLIAGGRFRYVGSDPGAIPAGTTVLDWSRWSGLPGLVDAHTHIGFVHDGRTGCTPWERLDELSAAEILPLAADNALLALRAGFTSCIDKGAPFGIDRSLRDGIEAGRWVGPRVFAAGEGIYRPPEDAAGAVPGYLRSPEDIAAEVRRQVGAGSDLIKMWADRCSDRHLDCERVFERDEIAIAARVTHALGRKLAVHAYRGDVARDAVLAGADCIEHAVDLDPATLALMARRRVIYVPTVDHNRYYRERSAWFGTGPEEDARFDAFVVRNLETIRAAHRAGVSIALGSDAVFDMFGENARELGWLVAGGMTPLEAFRAATWNAARSIGREHEIGDVAPGYLADLVAVEGDPRLDVDAAIARVRGVLRGGQVVALPARGRN